MNRRRLSREMPNQPGVMRGGCIRRLVNEVPCKKWHVPVNNKYRVIQSSDYVGKSN